MRLSLVLLSLLSLSAKYAVGQLPQTCECYDVQACPVDILDPKSLCACQNQQEFFCWRRSGKNTCAKPSPLNCDKLNSKGIATERITAEPSLQTAVSSFTPKSGNTGAGGLNCVDLGYCFRPTKARTTLTLTLPNGTAIVTVPVGLPTDALPTLGVVPTPTQSEPLIVFTPEARMVGRDRFVTMAMTKAAGEQ